MAAARPYPPSARSAPLPDDRPGEVAELAARLGRLIGRLRVLDLDGVTPAPVFRAPAGPAPTTPGPVDAPL
ncbi:hypothetical protein [Streptomyces griseofuscus]|uniref:hypothetical protein n=1 Tax=Streptomyces griseofuscus TaxID=146922 RepID=UPI003455AE9F